MVFRYSAAVGMLIRRSSQLQGLFRLTLKLDYNIFDCSPMSI